MKLFKAHSKVLVRSLKQEGVVVEALKTGEYRIACGSLTLVRPASDLEALAPDQWKKYSKHSAKRGGVFVSQNPSEQISAKDSIDLHGIRVADALPMVETFIDRALVGDLARVEIVHGVGTGKLLTAVHAYLKKQSSVKRFQLDDQNPGVTVVYF